MPVNEDAGGDKSHRVTWPPRNQLVVQVVDHDGDVEQLLEEPKQLRPHRLEEDLAEFQLSGAAGVNISIIALLNSLFVNNNQFLNNRQQNES